MRLALECVHLRLVPFASMHFAPFKTKVSDPSQEIADGYLIGFFSFINLEVLTAATALRASSISNSVKS